jgi:microcystin-dependent protein
MAQVDMKGDAPIGAIVPFFGAVTATKLKESGWLVCDGATLQQIEWPDLHAAIGQAFGYQVKESDFCLPDLRGVLLRTVDAGAGRDKDVEGRTGSGPGGTGNAKDAIGSFEQDSTAMPRAGPFRIRNKFDVGGNKTHGGLSHSQRIEYKDSAGAVDFAGGDAESRPVNLNGAWLIKAKANSSADPKLGPIPLGCAIALPVKVADDTPIDDYWRYCDGQTFIAAEGSSFYPLYTAIGTANGGVKQGDSVQRFAIPDLRGLFVRGAGARPRTVDTSDTRQTPRPDLSIEGNGGAGIGSYQDWATAPPRGIGAKFSVGIPSYPFISTSGYQAGVANAAKYRDHTETFDVVGGDPETRPISMAVEWFVRFRGPAPGAKPGEELPVGVLIATGSAAQVANWLPCQGQSLLIADYEALFKVIGKTFGGDSDTTFALPDLRGRFLRGAGDPDATYPRPRGKPEREPSKVQDFATGAPHAKFTASASNWPGNETSNIVSYGTGYNLLKLEGDASIASTGGDAETRPFNVYVQHLIKARP